MQNLNEHLQGPWLQTEPHCIITPWQWQNTRTGFMLRDDLLHPWASGNKIRKLDAILSRLPKQTQHIITCGGIQSAHCLAVAALSRQLNLTPHLLVRGEPQPQPTGNLAMTMLFGHLYPQSYDDYADREKMFETFLQTQDIDPTRAYIIPEGGCYPPGLLGLIRLVGMMREHLPTQTTLVIDAGTGASAVGLALGILHFKLDWRVEAVCLLKGHSQAMEIEARALAVQTAQAFLMPTPTTLPIQWFERIKPRRFGQFNQQDIKECIELSRQTSVVVDPIYTLAAWRHCLHRPSTQTTCLINTGGGLNIMGAIQRKPTWFHEHC